MFFKSGSLLRSNMNCRDRPFKFPKTQQVLSLVVSSPTRKIQSYTYSNNLASKICRNHGFMCVPSRCNDGFNRSPSGVSRSSNTSRKCSLPQALGEGYCFSAISGRNMWTSKCPWTCSTISPVLTQSTIQDPRIARLIRCFHDPSLAV